MRSVSSLRFLLSCTVLMATVGCFGCPDDGSDPEGTANANVSFPGPHTQKGDALPAGDSSSTAKIDESAPQLSATGSPAQLITFDIPYVGGPIDRVRLSFGSDAYYEFEVDHSRADAQVTEDTGDSERAEITLASSAANTAGSVQIDAEVSSLMNLSDAVEVAYSAQVQGADGKFSEAKQVGKLTLCTQDDDCTPGGDPDPGSGGGAGGGGGQVGPTATWKDTWVFVQSDKAVQKRIGLVSKTGTTYKLKIQYRVNSSDGIYCSNCNGYHLYAETADQKFRVQFPADFTMGKCFEPPNVFEVDLQPPYNAFDETEMRVIREDGTPFPYSCVDDNSAASRCASWENGNITRYDATNNCAP